MGTGVPAGLQIQFPRGIGGVGSIPTHLRQKFLSLKYPMVNKFKDIPSTDSLLKDPSLMEKVKGIPKKLVKEAIRETAQNWRKKKKFEFSREDFIEDIRCLSLRKSEINLKRVINAQGVILSTNLGRAILPKSSIDSVVNILGGYSNLEFDLEKGERGDRDSHVKELLKKLTKAEDALIVNNNAAAIFITLNTLAEGKEVIVSRGELIEIGGSFRLPEILAKSGAKLKEVGTTNRTYLKDYENAISEATGLLLKSHTSNYKIIGFTQGVSTEELVKLGRKRGIPVVEDLGSGLFIDLRKFKLPHEPTVQEVVNTGVDIVTFSGDKLMGGPQAGIILGKKKYLEKIASNPLLRIVRVDKMVIAAMEAVLRIYLYDENPLQALPCLSMIIEPLESIRKKALNLAEKIKPYFKGNVEVIEESSEIGGGSYPGTNLKSFVVALTPSQISADNLAKRLRTNTPPIIPRIKKDRILLDLRTVNEDEIELIVDFFRKTEG